MSGTGTLWMRLCGYRVSGSIRRHDGAARQALARSFAARLWAQSTDADRVQHIRIRYPGSIGDEPAATDSGHQELRLDVGILLMADSDDKARAVGARLCTGALAAGPDTVGWTLQPLF